MWSFNPFSTAMFWKNDIKKKQKRNFKRSYLKNESGYRVKTGFHKVYLIFFKTALFGRGQGLRPLQIPAPLPATCRTERVKCDLFKCQIMIFFSNQWQKHGQWNIFLIFPITQKVRWKLKNFRYTRSIDTSFNNIKDQDIKQNLGFT